MLPRLRHVKTRRRKAGRSLQEAEASNRRGLPRRQGAEGKLHSRHSLRLAGRGLPSLRGAMIESGLLRSRAKAGGKKRREGGQREAAGNSRKSLLSRFGAEGGNSPKKADCSNRKPFSKRLRPVLS